MMKMIFKYTYVLAAATAARAGAQGLDRSQRPVAPPAAPIHGPRVVADSLPNGLRYYVVETHAVPVVAVRAVLGADSTSDPAGKDGVSRVMIDAMREGTTSRSAEQLSEAGAAIGTSITPTAFTTTAAGFGPALGIMADMLEHPAFDSAGVERRKALQLARVRTLAQAAATPGRRLLYINIAGPEDALSRTLAANTAAVASITRNDVVHQYEQLVGPATTVIVIAGDITPRVAREQLVRAFGGWRSAATLRRPAIPAAPAAKPTTIYLLDAPGANAYVGVGGAGPARGAGDAVAADVMASILGTRLQRELRDKRGLMYSGNVGVIWRPESRPSLFVGSTIVPAAKIDSALSAWLGVLKPAPTADEFAAASRFARGVLANGLDGADSLATTVVDIVRAGLPVDQIDRTAGRLNDFTIADAAAAAKRYTDPEHLVIVVVGDRKVMEPILRSANLAPVVVVDASGKPIG